MVVIDYSHVFWKLPCEDHTDKLMKDFYEEKLEFPNMPREAEILEWKEHVKVTLVGNTASKVVTRTIIKHS